MMRRHKPDAGFSLLELIVAMALMSMVAGALYASLHCAFQAWDSAQRTLTPVCAAKMACSLLRYDLESALPPTGILAGAFIGTDDTDDDGYDSDIVSFYCTSHDPQPDDGTCEIQFVEVGIDDLDDDSGHGFLRRVTTNLLAPETPDSVEEMLCRSVRSLNFVYYDGYDWLDSWDSTTQGDSLPLAVEVTIELQPEADADPDAEGYKLTRLLLLPCAGFDEESGGVIGGMSGPR